MAEHFGHERLKVYQKGMQFASMRKTLLDDLPRRVAACDHLDRGAESILLNIAHASRSWAPKERIVYLGNASGSALECAACLDIFVARALVADQAKFLGIAYKATVQSATLVDLTTDDSCPADPSPVEEGRDLLRRIAAMLRQLSKAVRDDI
jgi:four helix bundle protein